MSWVVIYRMGNPHDFYWRINPRLMSKEAAEHQAQTLTSIEWPAKPWPAGKAPPTNWEGVDDATIQSGRREGSPWDHHQPE